MICVVISAGGETRSGRASLRSSRAVAKASTASVAAARANVTARNSRYSSRKPAHAIEGESKVRGNRSAASILKQARAGLPSLMWNKAAALEQAQLNLGYTKIVAPVSGEVNKTS